MSGGVYSMFGQAAEHLAQQGTTDTPSSSAQIDWSFEDPNAANALDLVFIQDATGSMGTYIKSATANIETICDNIIASERLSAPGALRIGLVAFRDHPPQDYTYIVRNYGFSSNVSQVKERLGELYASGGGDGPEAITAALKSTLEMDWRPNATRLAVLITDAPPHGIKEHGDGFAKGSPDGEDPLVLARQMAQAGISLFMVACEPALSNYKYAVDFYQALVRITSGLLVPLTTASLLTYAIIAAAGEAMALDRMHRQFGDDVAEMLRTMSLEAASAEQSNPGSGTNINNLMDDVARDLHQRLLLRNESTKQLVVESIYRESEESHFNIETFTLAVNLEAARPHLRVVNGTRLTDTYRATRRANTSFTTHAPYPGSSRSPGSGGWAGSASPQTSPSRKVVSTFSTFSAGGAMSMGGTEAASSSFGSAGANPTASPPRGPAFFGARGAASGNRMAFDDDDDDDDVLGGRSGPSANDGDDSDDDAGSAVKPLPQPVNTFEGAMVAGDDGSKLLLREGAISFEQAKRLAMQSAYRSGLA